MNYLQAFPEWNFYTRPDCELEPPENIRLSAAGKDYKAGDPCLVLIAQHPVDPVDELPHDFAVSVRIGRPLESTVCEEGYGWPVGKRALVWLEKGNEVYGWESPHHENPDHWDCVIAWRPLNKT